MHNTTPMVLHKRKDFISSVYIIPIAIISTLLISFACEISWCCEEASCPYYNRVITLKSWKAVLPISVTVSMSDSVQACRCRSWALREARSTWDNHMHCMCRRPCTLVVLMYMYTCIARPMHLRATQVCVDYLEAYSHNTRAYHCVLTVRWPT